MLLQKGEVPIHVAKQGSARSAGIAQRFAHAGQKLREEIFQHRFVQPFLGLEVVVQQGLVYPSGGNLLRTGTGQAAFGEQAPGSGQQCGAGTTGTGHV